MQYFARNGMRAIAWPLAAMALTLGACSGSIEKMSELVPKVSDLNVTKLELNPYSKASMSVAPTFKQGPVTAADYVGADGGCAGAAEEPVSAAVGLTMTECEAVRALGMPEKVDIGANERSERLVRLTYLRGERAGLYVFTAGRLTEIQRLAEPAPPPKRQPAKPRPRPAT